MIIAEFLSLAIYILSLIILKDFFGKMFFIKKFVVTLKHFIIPDADFIKTGGFMWRTAAITAVSCVPLYIWKFLRKRFSPTAYQKLS